MNVLRRLSTTRLLLLLAGVVVAAVAAAIASVAAFGGSGATPPPEPLAQALHDAAAAPEPAGVTARVTFTNNLFPSGSLLGQAGSALMSGASGRLWATNDGRGRIELQSDAGDVQIVWSPTLVTVYDASSNTAYELSRTAHTDAQTQTKTPPTADQISSALTKLARFANVSGATPTNVGGEPAYSVTVSPKQNGGLVGYAQLAWDAEHGVPLEVAVTAKGSSTPVLELKVDSISFGAVPSSDVDVSPPAGAHVVDLGSPGGSQQSGSKPAPVTGLAAVQAAVPFTLVAPDTLNGASRTEVRLVGKDAALVVYGQGLGATLVLERQAQAGSGSAIPSQLSGVLPKVSLGNGTSATELSTPLGTVLTFDRAGVRFLVGGSVARADAEAAARSLAS